MNRCVCCVAIGENNLYKTCIDSQRKYAKRIGVEYILITKTDYRFQFHLYLNKLRAFDLLSDYEEVLYLDADVFIKDDAANIFNSCKKIHFDLAGLNEGIYRDTDFPVKVILKQQIGNRIKWPKDSNGNFVYYNTGVLLLRKKSKRFLDYFNLEEFLQIEGIKLVLEQTYFNWIFVRAKLKTQTIGSEFNHMFFTDWYNKSKASFIHFANVNKVYGRIDTFDSKKYNVKAVKSYNGYLDDFQLENLGFYQRRNQLLRINKSGGEIQILYCTYSNNILIRYRSDLKELLRFEIVPRLITINANSLILNRTKFIRISKIGYYSIYFRTIIRFHFHLLIHYGVIPRVLRVIKFYIWMLLKTPKLYLINARCKPRHLFNFYYFHSNPVRRFYFVRRTILQQSSGGGELFIKVNGTVINVQQSYVIKNQDNFLSQMFNIYDNELLASLQEDLLGGEDCFIYDDSEFLYKVLNASVQKQKFKLTLIDQDEIEFRKSFLKKESENDNRNRCFLCSDTQISKELILEPRGTGIRKHYFKILKSDFNLLSTKNNEITVKNILPRKTRNHLIGDLESYGFQSFEHKFACLPSLEYDKFIWLKF